MATGGWPLAGGMYSIENYAAISPMYLDKLESADRTWLRVQNNLVDGQPKLDVSQLWLLRKIVVNGIQCYTVQNYATETYLRVEEPSGYRYVYCSPNRPRDQTHEAWTFQQQDDGTYKICNVKDGRLLEVEDCPPRDQVAKDRNSINGKYCQLWSDAGQQSIRWYCNKYENYDSCNWMASLPDSMLIWEMTIPATHQTHALDTAVGWEQVKQSPKCHDAGTYAQLRQGIRYLDVRIDVNNGEMRVVHGVWAMDTPFAVVLEDIRQFLETYPREMVILRLNRETEKTRITGENTFLDYLKDSLKPFWSMFVRGSSENPLVNCRGKCLLVTGDNNINQVHYRERFWPQDPHDEDMLGAIAMTSGYWEDPVRWDNQDLWENLSVDEKWARVQQHLEAAMDTVNNGQRCYATALNMSKIQEYYPRQRADALNPRLQGYLDSVTKQNPRARIGIVNLDFPPEKLIRTLIRFNGVSIGESALVYPRVNSTQ